MKGMEKERGLLNKWLVGLSLFVLVTSQLSSAMEIYVGSGPRRRGHKADRATPNLGQHHFELVIA